MKLYKTASKTSSGPSSSSVPRTFNGVGKKKKNFKYKKTNNDKKNNKHNDNRHGKSVHKSKQKWKKTKKKKAVVNENEKKTVINGKHEKKTKDNQTNKSTAQKAESGGIGLCYVPTDPAECSSNWRKLSTTILGSSPQEEPTTGKKKKLIGAPDSQLKVLGIHGNVLLNDNSEQKSNVKKKEKMQETSITKKADIWFDDVDEALIEPATLSEEPVESETKLIQTTAPNKVTTCVALDCEMVGTGESGNDDMLARVSVVNQYGHCLYDKYVKPMAEITDYRTCFSGITPNLLKDGTDFKTVQKDVGNFIKDRILVGHALHNDFKVLFMDHPKQLIRDTTKYKPFRKLNRNHTPSLKMLAKDVLGIAIQQGSHSSVIDAQVAMKLYMKHRKDWESRLKHKKLQLKQKRKQMKAAKKKKKNKVQK